MEFNSLLHQCLSTLILLGIIINGVSCFDYCTVPCRTRSSTYKHTMCLYPRTTAGSLCTRFDPTKELKSEDKELLLKVHNQLRSKVAQGKESRGSPGPQFSAADMMELVWDDELELIARRWAYQCDYNHDKCRQTKNEENVGQNLAVTYESTGFKNDLEKMVTSWYDEVDFTPNRIAHGFASSAGRGGEAIGHYTQMVWGESSRMGCARVFFDFSDWGMTEYLVCNYGKGGNTLKAPLYKVGKSCSACSSGLKCSLKYPGLCAREVVVEKPEIVTSSVAPETEDTEASTEGPDEEDTAELTEASVEQGVRSTTDNTLLRIVTNKPETGDSVPSSDDEDTEEGDDNDDQAGEDDTSFKTSSDAVQGAVGVKELVVSSIVTTLLVKFFF